MNSKEIYKSVFTLSAFLALMIALYSYNFLLFHNIAELASIAIAWSVFILVWNARTYNPSNTLIYFGITLLFVGVLDLIHTLAYKGMNIFSGYDANLPTQFWIAARYFQSISFAALPFFNFKKLDYKKFTAINAVIFSAVSAGIFYGAFPDCYIEGAGLTSFKIYFC